MTKWILVIAILCFWLTGIIADARRPPAQGITFPATCTRVIDGDTIVVEIKTEIHLRLPCNAPEGKETRSAQRLRENAEGKPVIVHIPLAGSFAEMVTFERWLGDAWLETRRSESLSEDQIATGNAKSATVQFILENENVQEQTQEVR